MNRTLFPRFANTKATMQVQVRDLTPSEIDKLCSMQDRNAPCVWTGIGTVSTVADILIDEHRDDCLRAGREIVESTAPRPTDICVEGECGHPSSSHCEHGEGDCRAYGCKCPKFLAATKPATASQEQEVAAVAPETIRAATSPVERPEPIADKHSSLRCRRSTLQVNDELCGTCRRVDAERTHDFLVDATKPEPIEHWASMDHKPEPYICKGCGADCTSPRCPFCGTAKDSEFYKFVDHFKAEFRRDMKQASFGARYGISADKVEEAVKSLSKPTLPPFAHKLWSGCGCGHSEGSHGRKNAGLVHCSDCDAQEAKARRSIELLKCYGKTQYGSETLVRRQMVRLNFSPVVVHKIETEWADARAEYEELINR